MQGAFLPEEIHPTVPGSSLDAELEPLQQPIGLGLIGGTVRMSAATFWTPSRCKYLLPLPGNATRGLVIVGPKPSRPAPRPLSLRFLAAFRPRPKSKVRSV